MQIGWIDFSKSDRDKVKSVLDLFSKPGVLDELGIALIRDGFSNLFFPGTTTIQTRAKYFLMIPYTFRDLESMSTNDPDKLKTELNALEKQCASILDKNYDGTGIIGVDTIKQPQWVKRPPSSIYWAGLRTYGIFKHNLSINEYIKEICSRNYKKRNLSKSGNYNDGFGDGQDVKGGGDIQSLDFWNISTYDKKWQEKLKMDLTKEEGEFLRDQIINSCPCSMFAFILKYNCRCILDCNSFSDLEPMLQNFPKEIKTNFCLAKCFSDFNKVLKILYNGIILDEENEEMKKRFVEEGLNLEKIAKIRLDLIYNLFGKRDVRLERFLNEAKDLMKDENLDGLRDLIKKREISLKGENRSKTCHPEQYRDKVTGAYDLEYRFRIAKNIAEDIFKSQDIVEDKCLTEGDFEC